MLCFWTFERRKLKSHSKLPRWESIPDYFRQLSVINEMGSDTVGAFFLITGMYDACNRIIRFKSHRIYKYSFFLYASHYLPLHILQRYIIFHNHTVLTCWAAYIMTPVVVAILSIAVGYYIDKRFHRLYMLLSGGR